MTYDSRLRESGLPFHQDGPLFPPLGFASAHARVLAVRFSPLKVHHFGFLMTREGDGGPMFLEQMGVG